MNSLEAEYFINKEIKERWNKWEPTEKQVSDWLFILQKTPNEAAKEAIIQTRIKSERIMSPVIGEFFKEVENILAKKRPRQSANTFKNQSNNAPSHVTCYLVVNYIQDYFKPKYGRGIFLGKTFQVALYPFDRFINEAGEIDGGKCIHAAKNYHTKLLTHYSVGREGNSGNFECEIYIGECNRLKCMRRSHELEAIFEASEKKGILSADGKQHHSFLENNELDYGPDPF